LDLSGFEITGKDSELLTPIMGSRRGLTLVTVVVLAGGVLVDVFFLYITVLNPSGSRSEVGPEGEVPAAATSLYDKVVPAGIERAGKA
jgi:hypothetical protein